MWEIVGTLWEHSETILKTFGKQTESIRWYIGGKHILGDIQTVKKITPLSYTESKRKLIRASVIAPLDFKKNPYKSNENRQ